MLQRKVKRRWGEREKVPVTGAAYSGVAREGCMNMVTFEQRAAFGDGMHCADPGEEQRPGLVGPGVFRTQRAGGQRARGKEGGREVRA